MNFYHWFGYSGYRYGYPVHDNGEKPTTYLQRGFRSPGHTGPFYHAIDFVIPDPREQPLPIIAPASGRIVALVQRHTEWGSTSAFKGLLNFVTVQVDGAFGAGGSEFYEFGHIAAGSCQFSVDQFVEKGVTIGKTGMNGWITTTDDVPDYHLHFMVGVWGSKFGEFRSLRVRFERD